MGWNLLGALMPPAADAAEEKERRYSRDLGAEEEFEILAQEEIKERRHSADSGNESQEDSETLGNENQEILNISHAKDLSLENAMLANFPDDCDRSFIVESKDEDSYDIIPKNLTFAKIVNIFNQAVREDNCEELDKVVQNIEEYEGRSIMLDIVNLKSFCEQQLNLNLQNNQHIYSNILSQYKFDQENFEYHYSVKELVLLAIAANDKLAEKYQDILFAEGNLSLLPLLVGSQKYIEVFIEKFHGIDGVYDKVKDQTIQLGELNKIGFFSVIALRKEQELLKTVLVEHVLKDFEHVLKTSDPDPLYGVLETASLVKNEKFITIVLNAFERYINEPTKDVKDLLKRSFVTLLETAISQEHLPTVKYLCERYLNNKDCASYDIYEQAFADDRVIKVLNQQILKNIEARGRKEIYDLVLRTALDAGNIALIEHLRKGRPERSNDVNEHFKDEDTKIIESLTENMNEGSKSFVVDLPAEVDSDSFDIIPEDTVFDLGHIAELVKKAVDDKDVNTLGTHIDFFQDHVTHVSSKEGLSVVEKTLEIVNGLIKEQSKAWSCYPTVPIASHIYATKQQYYDGYISQADYERVENLKKTLCKIKSDLIKRSSNDHNAGSSVINAKDTSAILNETPTPSQAINGEDNNQLNTKESKNQQPQRSIVDKGENIMVNQEASKEAVGNNFEEGKMHSSDQNIKTIEEELSDAIFDLNCEKVRSLVEQVKQEDNSPEQIIHEALKKANKTEVQKKDKKSLGKIEEMRRFLQEELEHIAAASSQKAPVVEPEESELDSPSQSSEDDDFSKLEGDKSDDSTRTASSSPLFEVIDDEAEAPMSVVYQMAELEVTTVMATERAEAESDNLDDEEYVSNGQRQSTQPGTSGESADVGSVHGDEEEQSAGQPNIHGEQKNNLTANEDTQPKPVANEQDSDSSESNQKAAPQNTKKYVVAASALTIAGIALGVAVAVYLEMLALGIAVAACCLIVATAIYCHRPKTLIENDKVEKVDDVQKNTSCCS